MNIRFLDDTYKGWSRMWEAIVKRYGDASCYDEASGEVWQYMGSTDDAHQFRHRSLKGNRTYYNVPAKPDDFEVMQ